MTAAPSQQELNNLAAACQRLWSLDVNGLQPGQDYDLNPQVGCTSIGLRVTFFSPCTLCVVAIVWQEVLHGARCSAWTPIQCVEPCGLSAETHLFLVLCFAR